MTHVAGSQMHTLPVKLLLVICAAAPSCVVLKSVYRQFDPLSRQPTYSSLDYALTEKEIALGLTSENEWRGLMNAILSFFVCSFLLYSNIADYISTARMSVHQNIGYNKKGFYVCFTFCIAKKC